MRDKIDTWEVMKRELKEQFLLGNASWLARESLRRLRHTGSTREYVKSFSSLLLDIRDMSEQDKLFNFLTGLQPWAQTELRRLDVNDLPSAIAGADRLADYKTIGSVSAEPSKPSARDKGKGKECPQRGRVSAIQSQEEEQDDVPSRVNPLQMLGAMQAGAHVPHKARGLMYVKIKINGKEVMAMVDTDATHNFVADREISKLGLEIAQHRSKMKAVNLEAQPVKGQATTELQIGSWKGRVEFMAIPLDDFDVILGIEFLAAAHVAVMPHLGGIFIAAPENPSFIPGRYEAAKEKKATLLSTMQLKKGLRRGEHTYVATLVEMKPDVYSDVPSRVAYLMGRFEDIMPPKLPKVLPPKRNIDHRIELEPGAVIPAKAPYRMGPSELVELRKQLTELLEGGLIRPSKTPYGSPILFQKKTDGSLRMCVDYRALNKIDLRSGYWQVRVATEDVAKTTCVTRYGSYEFLVMPFGLINAPATFCNLMNDVLYERLDRSVVVYLDDILVYSASAEEHYSHLEWVFEKLREHHLYINKGKCEFCLEQINFLGHIVGHGEIRMDPTKVVAIEKWPRPS
ncbi:uncharacterized protein LOC124938921 [Impatiens glandulifera]|uniref:uncharacterized protein LOC124938921 n=1 Tax=Impatiens glandulifera TaxID=253017 RepID=UPI001FB0BD91|nr:uncharacterized protein LOC124938921 [Impatiens glandulifera]